jgi:cobyrinic acid a,c-diamide synthase
MSQIFISAAHKSSGKTTLSMGLCRALWDRGYTVQPFKKGPDYIDPMWLGHATGRPCHNLDFHTMDKEEILATFSHYSQGSQLSLIEGNKGLYDGLDLDGSNSNAALAKLLGSPIILVIDAEGMTRGIAPLILGYQAFDPEINISGVILNRLGGSRHEAKLRAVIEHYTEVQVLGAVHRDAKLALQERHLGLIPSNETEMAEAHIQSVANRVAQQVNLDHIIQIGASAKAIMPEVEEIPARPRSSAKTDIRIGIAQDMAFGFYYPGDLEAFQAAGAQLVPINTLTDTLLPDIDGLFIGGGFPETQMSALEANRPLRSAILAATEKGLPVYAECGGLMYLSRSISWQGKRHEMVGAIPADSVMCPRPQGRGYVKLMETADAPWPGYGSSKRPLCAHEFHYSKLENLPDNAKYAYQVKRGSGITGHKDGIVHRNILACYSHFRDVKNNHWVQRFVDFVRKQRNNGKNE